MITLDKAIKINARHATLEDKADNHTLAKALRLGIEALKRIKKCRHADYLIDEDYLPGETKQ